MERGNERKRIFNEEDDKVRFLDTLLRMKEKYNYKIYAYCLMENHVHILIDTNGSDISQIMRSINVSYVKYFNEKYNRVGHLFQDRFKSEIVEDEGYLLEVSRYIHLNPVKAKMVNLPEDYMWSSYSIYLGKSTNCRSLVDVSLILGIFSPDIKKALTNYMSFVNKNEEKENCQIEHEDIMIDIPEDEKLIKSNAFNDEKNMENIIKDFLKNYGVSSQELSSKEPYQKEIRNLLIKKLRQETHLTLAEIGNKLGLSESMVSRILNFRTCRTCPPQDGS